MRVIPFASLLVLLAATSAVADGADAPSPAPASTAKGSPSAHAASPAPAPSDNVQALVNVGHFKEAVEQVAGMRKSSAKGIADPDSEYWAAKAEQKLGDLDAAKARLHALAAAWPDSPRALDALVEAPVLGVDLGKGHVENADERKRAATAAAELDALLPLQRDAASAARVAYSAGNAWRIAEDDAKAGADYQKAIASNASDWPSKATYMSSLLSMRALDDAGARTQLGSCMTTFRGTATEEKCRKDLARWQIVGSPAPPLTVETWVHGDAVDIAALKGNVVLVWFFATWCPHCKATMPEIAAMTARYAGKPFRVVAITANDQGQTTESTRSFAADPQWKISYPVGVDKGRATSQAWNAMAVPTAVLVDKKGVIRWIGHPGYLANATVEKLLAE